jgi:hypothetical protein
VGFTVRGFTTWERVPGRHWIQLAVYEKFDIQLTEILFGVIKKFTTVITSGADPASYPMNTGSYFPGG